MIKIMYQHRSCGGWECIGSYIDLKQATKDFEKYKRGVLGETGILKLKVSDDGKLFDMVDD